MSEKERILREVQRFEAAGALASACTTLFGALKATELRLPRLVVNALPSLETALNGWSDALEIEDSPESEGTRS
jgi:hypothetical protein